MYFIVVFFRLGVCVNFIFIEFIFEWKEIENKLIKYIVNCREISVKERNKVENV